MRADAIWALPARAFTAETMVGSAFLGIVALLIIPVPPIVLDLLLALSIAISAVVFLTSLFSQRPTDFSIFPTLLLISTLLRLSLNIASTRLILTKGHEGTGAAGQIINAFSDFVVGGDLAVGVIVFLALVIINFVVITKGAGRIAEVSARFTLDAMQGKLMAVDTELSAGAIDDVEAKRRRAAIQQESDFYATMDGANKFIRGDAIAGIIITAINLVGGLLIGIINHGVDIGVAAKYYSTLTIGDGLVSQMPALVVSTAAGIAMSRASAKTDFGREVVRQMLGMRTVLGVSAGFLLLIGALPGLPLFPFGVLAGGLILAAVRQDKFMAPAEPEKPADTAPPEKTEREIQAESLRVEALKIDVGFGLIPMADGSGGGTLPAKVKDLRRQLAQSMGVIVPPVRVADSMNLEQNQYVISLSGTEVARGSIVPDRVFAMDVSGQLKVPDGIPGQDPVFGQAGQWIPRGAKRRAEAQGAYIVEPDAVITTHLSQILRENVDVLLGRDSVQDLVDFVRDQAPRLVGELLPDRITYAELGTVLRLLLSEQVSIRDMKTILETINFTLARTKRPEDLAEACRRALGRHIAKQIAGRDGVIRTLMLDRALEDELLHSIGPNGDLIPRVGLEAAIVDVIRRQVATNTSGELLSLLVTASPLRRPFARLFTSRLPHMPIVSQLELAKSGRELRVLGSIAVS